MTNPKNQPLLKSQFHEAFEAMAQMLAELLPVDQRSAEQQRLLEVVDFQIRVLNKSQCRLRPSDVEPEGWEQLIKDWPAQGVRATTLEVCHDS